MTIADAEDDFQTRSRRQKDPKPTGGSWWIEAESRAEFYKEIAKRFAVNKPETDAPGLSTWTKAPRPKEAA
jgi:hypothetical protein